MNHLIENNLIVKEQHGFIKSKSCVTNLLEALDILTELTMKGKCADIAFLDFAKAFDSVANQRLILKMESYGIKGLLLNW